MSNINFFAEFDENDGQDRDSNNGHSEQKIDDDFIVFGYSCKLFRDDFSAKAIERGQSLIPWNGDENVMIDRYDCRGHLFDLTPWDSDLLRTKSDRSSLTEAEQRIENECDQERYLDLYKDVEKEELQKEEEYKRLCADKNAYNQVGLNYDEPIETTTIKSTKEPSPPIDDDEYEPFYPSEKLQLPYGMDIPQSIKLNAVIEKTASFVSNAGLQMEIVVKTKQANNPQFDFLKYDHFLNPYYRHLITMIKSGKYRPNVDNQSTNNVQKKKTTKNGVDANSSHDDEDEGNESYLHPLLRGGTTHESHSNNKKADETLRLPTIPMNIHNTAYGQLIKKYEHLRQREKIDEEKMSTTSDEMKNDESSPRSESSTSSSVIPPPPDVKPIIDKLAEYVARNGPAFEQSIRTKNDSRFGFLERDHIHYNYYQLKLHSSIQEIQRKANEENQRRSTNDEQQTKSVFKATSDEALTPTSFRSDEDSNSMSINESDGNGEFIGPRPPSPSFIEKMRKQEQRRDRVNEFVREKLVREKQEERKRKAEMLVQQLKTKTNETSTTSPTVNPILVEKLLNVKNERSSTTMKTSPSAHRRVKHSRSSSKYRRRSRSKSNHRRTRRSRTPSKSRSHHRSKRSKNSKSSRHSRDRRHRRHRRHSSSGSSRSRSSSNSSTTSSSSSTSSSNERHKKKKIDNESQPKKNPHSSKWDQREPVKVKSVTPSTALSQNNETTLSNSNNSS